MSRYRIALAAGTFADTAVEQEQVGDRALVTLVLADDADRLRTATEQADALIVTNHLLDRARIAALGGRVRVIGRAGIGLDAIDLAAAQSRGIAVLHVPDYATNEVATHAVAMTLAAHRRLVAADQVARTDWPAWRRIGAITPIEEQTVGIIGYGRIGRAVARRLTPFAGAIQVYDPQIQAAEPPVTVLSSLAGLLSTSDIVMLHASLTGRATPLLDESELALMRPGSILVNAARGALINGAALARALADGRIAGAALDVLGEEPPPADDPLLTAPNVLLSPHFGWYSASAERRARADTAAGLIEYLDGAPVTSATVVASVPSKPQAGR
jgi:D-3-phosphoglycerate dehydrogenase / 2-oxoglutarate reductase